MIESLYLFFRPQRQAGGHGGFKGSPPGGFSTAVFHFPIDASIRARTASRIFSGSVDQSSMRRERSWSKSPCTLCAHLWCGFVSWLCMESVGFCTVRLELSSWHLSSCVGLYSDDVSFVSDWCKFFVFNEEQGSIPAASTNLPNRTRALKPLVLCCFHLRSLARANDLSQ